MLKLIYTENGFYLELLTQTLEEWLQARVIFALRVGQSLYFEPSTASFLLPVDLPGLKLFQANLKRDEGETIVISTCDAEYLEVTLCGSWLSVANESSEGVFVTAMNYTTEFYLHKLWLAADRIASVLSE